MKASPLKVLKQCFEKMIPAQDSRTKISPLAFVVSLVFCHLEDSKTFSQKAIRRHMKAQLNQDISRSAFWERLSRDRLKKYLKAVVAELMSQMSISARLGTEFLRSLGVAGIWLVDSSSISLWDGAEGSFPGTRTEAGIKWHASFNLLTGVMNWFKFTPTSRHDRKCFPDIGSLKKVLVIFDLGYFDYGLLLSSLAAQLASNTIFNIGGQCLGQDQKLATSFQRVLKVSVDLSSEFIRFLLNTSKKHLDNLLAKIKLFFNEIFDPMLAAV